LVALEAELPNEMIPSWNVAYTGVGKVNAALKGSEYVARYKPMNLINFGTAGALNPELSGLLEVTQFFQRDMDARDMGFALGQTPFEEAPYVSARWQASIFLVLNMYRTKQMKTRPAPGRIIWPMQAIFL